MGAQPESIEFLRRVPPHSRELEEAVLSAILQEPVDAIRIAQEILIRDSFYYEAHQVIWEAAIHLHNRGVPPDPLALIAYLREMERLDVAGGESYIYQILAAVPNASAIEAHTTILHEKALLRKVRYCDGDRWVAAPLAPAPR